MLAESEQIFDERQISIKIFLIKKLQIKIWSFLGFKISLAVTAHPDLKSYH